MSKILCSTGALIGRPNGRDYKMLRTLSKQLDCDGFEFMMYSSWYEEVDELKNSLREMELCIPVMHCEKHIGESISKGGQEELADAYRRFAINCDIAQSIGAKKLVIHLWDGQTSDSNFSSNLAAYSHLWDKAQECELDLLVENVVCNVENPMKHWCELHDEYPDIHFIFDTKMAAFHAQLDLLYEPEYDWLWKEKHIRHYHVNDYAGGYMDWQNLRTLPIGKGNVDFTRFFDFINKIGYEDTFTVESTAFNSEGAIDVEMLNNQFVYMREALRGK